MNASSRWSADLPGDGSLERILLIKWGAMGDVVIATAALDDIARSFPNARIDLSTTAPWDALFEHDPRLHRVLTYRPKAQDAGVIGLLRLAKVLRAANYDAVLDMQSNDRSRILMYLLAVRGGPRYTVGFHRRLPYNVAPPRPVPPVHARTYAEGLLRAAGIEPRAARPVIHLADGQRAAMRARLAAHGLEAGQYAVVLPGCAPAGYLKRWGAHRYRGLIEQLVPARARRAVLVGAADEAEECAELTNALPDRVLNLCGHTSLLDVVALCEGAAFVVGNDTGAAHLASAAGPPVCVICGPTDPRRVAPLGPLVRTCQADLACINCYRKHCAHHACMSLVTPSQVAGVIAEATAACGADPAIT